MELGALRAYRHSGKFEPYVLLAVPFLGGLAVWPLALGYAFAVKWCPSVYLCVLLTLLYGYWVGCIVGLGNRLGRVRNRFVAVMLAIPVGVAANYLQWSAHVHVLFGGSLALSPPDVIKNAMDVLRANGSWSIGFHHDPVTGSLLVLVWLVEAAIIFGVAVWQGAAAIWNVPFCEKTGVWLKQTDRYDTLAAFTSEQEKVALKAGDLGPVIRSRTRGSWDNPDFARLTVRHAPRCQEFITVRVENVALETDRKGRVKERKWVLTKDLVLPVEMREQIRKFADVKLLSAKR